MRRSLRLKPELRGVRKMTSKQAENISKILEEIDIDVYPTELESFDSVDEVRDFLLENNYLDEEVIYYHNAIKYLSENDPSLQESLGLAYDLGYTADNINSELLASLLKSEELKEEFEEKTSEIEAILS